MKRLLIVALILSSSFLHAQQAQPNIIYIMTDDLGYADLSGYGRKDYATPNLDRLATQGMKLMNAYASAPLCTPTRVAFMTGRYPARLSLGLVEPMEWSARDSLIGLSADVPSIATRLHSAGYETYLVGKWHLGFRPEFSPLRNGFDYFFGFNGGGVDYVSHRSPRGGAADLYENYQPVQMEGYMTDLLAKKAIEVINKEHNRPFFLNVMFNAPHWPWQAPGDKAYPDTMSWRAGGSPAIYAAMMKSLDDAVGEILKALDAKRLSHNTLIIFTSDNGGERFSNMGIYRGKKVDLWEGGIRVPAFVRWPAKIRGNSVTQQVVTTMDWTATILSVAGAKPVPSFPLDGEDMTQILLGKVKETDRTVYWRAFQRIKHKAMREGHWKYMQDEKGQEYLFNLSADPYEKINMKETKPEIFQKLKDKYAVWESQMLKPVPL